MQAPVLPKGPVELYFLTGEYMFDSKFGSPRTMALPKFHDTPIITSSIISEELADRIRALLSNDENYIGEPMRCFTPRHGLRLGTGVNTVDSLICLECFSCYFWQADKAIFLPLSEQLVSHLKAVFYEARSDLAGFTTRQILDLFVK